MGSRRYWQSPERVTQSRSDDFRTLMKTTPTSCPAHSSTLGVRSAGGLHAVVAQGNLEQIEGAAGGCIESLANLVARFAGQDLLRAFFEQDSMDRCRLGRHDPLLRVVALEHFGFDLCCRRRNGEDDSFIVNKLSGKKGNVSTASNDSAPPQ